MAKKRTAKAKKAKTSSAKVKDVASGKINPFSWGSSFANSITQKADKNAKRVFGEKEGD